MTDHKHDWRETGERRAHVDFVYTDAKKRHRRCVVPAIYVRCWCGQVGYRRPGYEVVYTWRRTDAE